MKTNAQRQTSYDIQEIPEGMKWDFFLSRKALSELTKIPFTQIKIKDHLHIDGHPNFLVSLSHTKGIAIAAICDDTEVFSIGIDIEKNNRPVKDGYEKFFVNNEDKYDDLLRLWSEKEAAFKAISPYIHILMPKIKPLVLKDIWVKNSHFGLVGNNRKIGSLNYQTDHEYNIVTATLLLVEL